jgi:hypothetical protein
VVIEGGYLLEQIGRVGLFELEERGVRLGSEDLEAGGFSVKGDPS